MRNNEFIAESSSGSCDQLEAVRDLVFDELPAARREQVRAHVGSCEICALELDQLRLTSAALRVLPEVEAPQRIAFVSDKVFEPSLFWRFWNSGARLSFASALILSLSILAAAWHVRPVPQQSSRIQPVAAAVASGASVNHADTNHSNAIAKAVAEAVTQVRKEDAQMIQAAVAASEKRQQQVYRGQMVALQESLDVMRRKMTYSMASLASVEGPGQ